MNPIEVVTSNSAPTPKIKVFPDGISPEDYTKCKIWPNRRWAWEFLCRNQAFRNDSDAVVNGTDKEKSALCEIQWVIEFQLTAQKVNHVDKVVRISVTSSASFG